MGRTTGRTRTVAAAGLVMVLGVSACGSGPGGADQGGEGGELVFGLESSPDNLDPGTSASSANAKIIRQIYDSLVWQTADNEIEPWLAESWEISDDGTEYLFQLRQDVTFHDGTDFNAEAVCVNFDRIIDPEVVSTSAISSLGASYESCEVISEFEVEFTLAQPDSGFLSSLSNTWLGIQSPAAIEEFGQDLGLNPVGTGPFKFEAIALNRSINLVRNDDYAWAPEEVENDGPPHLARLTFEVISEPTTRFRSVGGTVNAAENVATHDMAAAELDPNMDVLVVPAPGAAYQIFLNQSREPWGDVEMRRAVVMATDIDTIVEALHFGVYPRARSPLTPATEHYLDTQEATPPFDPEAAGQVMEEQGWLMEEDGYRYKDGQRLSMELLVPSQRREKRHEIAQFMQVYLRDVGVDVQLQFLASGPYSAARDANNYDAMGLSLTSGYSALDAMYDSENYPAPGKGNYYNYAQMDSPEVDEWLEEAVLAETPEEAGEYWQAVQQYVIDESVSIPIYDYSYTVAMQNSVKDIGYTWQADPVFFDTYLED